MIDLTTPATRTVRLSGADATDLRVAAFFGPVAILPPRRLPATTDDCVKELVRSYAERADLFAQRRGAAA